MKCKYCGTNLTLENEVCPFCRRPNEDAKIYINKKKQYQMSLKEATKKVEKTTHYVKSFATLLVVAIVIAIMNIVLLFVKANAEDIRDWKQERDLNQNYESFSSRLDQELQEWDYTSFKQLVYKEEMYLSDKYREYSNLAYFASCYEGIEENILRLTDTSIAEPYWTKEECVDNLAWNILNFYENVDDSMKEYMKEYTTEKGEEQRVELINRTKRLMGYYLKLDQKQIEEFQSMSQTQIALIIGRSLGIYE